MTSNSIARFPWNHRSESRLVAAECTDSPSPSSPPPSFLLLLSLSQPRSPNINFNLHKCIIINSIVALADVRDVGYYSIRKILLASATAVVRQIHCPDKIFFSPLTKGIFSSLERGIIKFCNNFLGKY